MEVFRPAWLMVSRNPDFQAHYGLELGGTAKNPGPIFRMEDGSRFAPVVGKPGDGASPHGALVDEYHEHPTPDLYDTMKTGMGARTQPMQVVITTAGTDTSSPCHEHRGRVADMLKGTVDDDDDWKEFSTWAKANPNLGVSVFDDFLRSRHREAMQSATRQNILLCKHLDKWMNAGSAWMNMAKWGECARPDMELEQFKGCRAWLAFDLASKIDLAAMVAVVEAAPERFVVFPFAYLPDATVELPHNAHYRAFAAQGALTVTDGARTDFHRIEDDIRALDKLLRVQELAFDPREATYLVQQIASWASFECVEIPQSPAHMSEPMKELEGMVAAKTIEHPDDPCFNWMIGNVVLKQARGGGPVKYYYPAKERESAKIDGPVALIMAIKRALADEGGVQSIYENPELWGEGAIA
jgi:phage terminase large subunit-like protein